MKVIPRRPYFPFLTDFLEYNQAANHTIPYTKRMIERYGDACDVSFLGIRNYFIHDPDVIREMLTSQNALMQRSYFFKAFRKFLGQGLFTADGDLHKQQRKLMKPAFYPERIREYARIMVGSAEEEIQNMKSGEVVNVNRAMTRITLKVITRSMFGSGLDEKQIDEIGDEITEVLHLINKILQNPVSIYCLIHEIKIPVVKKFFRHREKLDRVVNGIIASYRKSPTPGRNDLLSLLLEAKDEDSGKQMSDEQIRDEVMTVFLAGHETTALALTWTLNLLSTNSSVEEKVREELNSVVKNRLPQEGDFQQLVFLKNVFRESLRLYPPAWTIARQTRKEVTINDYHFPKGSVLWTITYLVQRDPRYFHDPDLFLPERWEEEGVKQIPKYAYFPFGGGARMCIGEGFAWMEGILVLAAILQKVKFENIGEAPIEIDPVFSLRTKPDLKLKIQLL